MAGVPTGVHVSYGHVRIPSPTDLAQGGIVKLQGLAREFPDTPYRFNVLYLVSSHLPEGAVTLARWARRKGARVVINQNGVAYPGWHGPGWERVNAPMRELLALADHVFYQSAFCRRSADQFAGPTPAPHEVLHNAVDTSLFSPAPSAEARPLTLLLAGTHEAWYRYETAVRTLAELRSKGHDVRLLVAGRLRWRQDAAAAETEARQLVSSLQLEPFVQHLGRYTQAAAPRLFRGADILLHTKYNDPCPTVVIEAMACGLPVVYSASGGVPELVGDAGEGVPTTASYERDYPPPPAALADAVERVARERGRFAERARERAVRDLSLDHWLARHRAVFGAAA
jgi:glycosyltransferase involved in cell wall biosynthesis